MFVDSPLVGVPADLVYGPDGRLWFTETSNATPTISALHPSTNVITRFPIWDPSLAGNKGINTPHGITVGPDGAIWFTGLTNDRVGRITTSGSLSFYPPLASAGVSGNPGFVDIVTGADGNLWITARNLSSIYRLTTSGTFTAFATGVSGTPKAWGIAAAPDGTLWFAAPGSALVVRFTPGPSPVFTHYDVDGDATNIVVDTTGSVWFTMPEESAIGRLIPGLVTLITTVATPTEHAWPDGIAAGADGGIWFTERAVGQIGRADPLLMGTPGYEPSEQIITLPDPPHLAGPGAIVGLPDGTLWFGEEVRKIAHFTGTAAGAVPLPPQATIVPTDGPAPIVDPSTGAPVYSSSTVLEVRAASQGACIDQIRVEVSPCATTAFVTVVNVPSATASFQLPDDGCWTIRVTVTGPGGATVLPDAQAVVDDSVFPDTVDPVITVPDDVVLPATSSGGAAAAFEVTATDDQAGSVTITCDPPSGSVFVPGTTTVTCMAVDAAGNDVTDTFTVTVTVPPPAISVPATITLPATGVTTPVTFSATGFSVVDSRLPVTCTWAGSTPQTTLPSSPTYGQFTAILPPLLTTVTCTAADLHGQSVTAGFVADVTLALPTISAVVTYDTGSVAGTPYVTGTWTREDVRVRWVCPSVATTSCPGDTVLSASGADQSVSGTTTDAAGRSATATAGNIDLDHAAPVTAADVDGLPAPGGRYALSADVTLAATDAHSGVGTITYTIETFAFADNTKTTFVPTGVPRPALTVTGDTAAFTLDGAAGFEGRNVIRYRTTDPAGNLETGEFEVVVVNTIETRTTITSVRTLADGRIEVTARVAFFHDAGQAVPTGHIVIGTTTTGTVSATIGANGTAVAVLALAPGEYDITARFTEQMPYLASQAATRRGIAAQATAFVVWGANAGGVQVGQRTQFWGPAWTKQVVGGRAAFKATSSFKGWGGTVSGTSWSTKGGNTTEPGTVASYITVIITTATDRDGRFDRGNVAGYAVLRVEDPARYAADPGHDAYGRVIQTGP